VVARSKIRIFVCLLNEGTEVSRPTDALDLGDGLYKLLPTTNYDPTDEIWEFPPGSVVRCEPRRGVSGEYLVSVRQ